jgi:hypothetical protein
VEKASVLLFLFELSVKNMLERKKTSFAAFSNLDIFLVNMSGKFSPSKSESLMHGAQRL